MPQLRFKPASSANDLRQKTCHQRATVQVYHHKFTAESAAARIARPSPSTLRSGISRAINVNSGTGGLSLQTAWLVGNLFVRTGRCAVGLLPCDGAT
jgi:hypothetical protein